jgi:hypothetical protein
VVRSRPRSAVQRVITSAAVPLHQRDVFDLNREEVPVRRRTPAACGLGRVDGGLQETSIFHRHGAAAQLELAAGIGRIEDGRIQHEPGVTQEVARLVRAANQHQHQMSLDHAHLDRTDARSPVSANRADKNEAGPVDHLPRFDCQIRSRPLEVGPAKHRQPEAAKPGRTRRGGATRRASFTGGFHGSAKGAAPNDASRRSSGASP